MSESLFLSTVATRSGLAAALRIPAIHLDSWEFRKIVPEGSVMPNALIAWDVDGDGVEEVILGTTEGQLIIVKPDHRMPVYSRTIAATISVVLYSVSHRRLVLVTLEGQCEVTEGFVLPSTSASTTHSSVATSSNPPTTRMPTSLSSVSLPFVRHREVGVGGSSSHGPTTKSAPTQPLRVFNVPPNCICGDFSSDGDGGIIFLGSHDQRVYAYSLSGQPLGSLLLESPVSSMKCFTVPYPDTTPTTTTTTTAATAKTEQPTSVWGPKKGFHRRGKAKNATSNTNDNHQDSQGGGGKGTVVGGGAAAAAVNSSTPGNGSKTCREAVTGVPMLLVACTRRLVLLNASREDVSQWHDGDRCFSLFIQDGSRDAAQSPPIEFHYVHALNAPLHSFHSSHGSEAGNLAGQNVRAESILSEEAESAPRGAFLRPVWQMSMRPVSADGASYDDTSFFRGSGSVPSTLGESRLFSYEPPHVLVREDSAQRVATGGVLHASSMLDEEGMTCALEDVQIPVAVDVSVGRHKVQFAAAAEDGRCLVLEMALVATEETSRRANMGEDGLDRSFESSERVGRVVRLGARGHLMATMYTVWSAALKQQALVSRVRVFRVKNDVFCSVFVATDGTCYAVDSSKGVTIESHVKADASSFTIMAGGSTTHPLLPLVSTGAMGGREGLLNLTSPQQQQQQQHNLLRGPVGRTVSLVCVAVDELVISSVGSESYLSASTSLSLRGLDVQHSSALYTTPLKNTADAHPTTHTHSTPRAGECSTGGYAATSAAELEESPLFDEEEEELMLQLGTKLLEAEGYADPSELFAPEERKFVARKLCALGYSYDEWKMLESQDTGEVDFPND